MSVFSSAELYVLAALLGREFIFGVEGKTLEDNRSDLKDLYLKNFDHLQTRGLLEYRIDGTLLVDRESKENVKLLNEAENIILVETDLNNRFEKAHYFSLNDAFCKLTEEGLSYSLNRIDSFNEETLLDHYGININVDPVYSFSLPIITVKEVSDLYSSFAQTEGDNVLENVIEDPIVRNLIRGSLINKGNSFVMKKYKKVGRHIVNTDNLIMRFSNNYALRFSVNDGDTVIISIYGGIKHE